MRNVCWVGLSSRLVVLVLLRVRRASFFWVPSLLPISLKLLLFVRCLRLFYPLVNIVKLVVALTWNCRQRVLNVLRVRR